MKNRIFYLFTILSLFMIVSNVKAEELTEEQKAVVTNAKAYFNRGTYIQYDEATLTYLHKNYITRDQERFEPEDAISSYNKYTVCDNFAFLVYYNTFVNSNNKNYVINDRDVKYAGVSSWRKESYYYLGFGYQSIANSSSPYYNKDIVALKIENPSTNPVIEKINGVEYEKRVYDEEKMLQSKQKIIDTLQPGDIIAYSRKADKDATPDNLYFKKTNTASGHVILYAGKYDGKLMAYHAGNGNVYNFSAKKDLVETSKGTILYSDLDDYMNVASNGRKTFLHQRIDTIVIIRPLNEVAAKGYKLNSNSKARLNYPDLVVEKTATRSRYDTVGIGQTITYTIKLKNNGKSAYSNINVSASVPGNTTYVSSTDNKMNWNVKALKAGATKTITYTVRIKNDASLVGKYITNNNDYVGGIKLNEINTLIGNPLSTKSVSNLQTNIQDLKNKTYNSTEEFINEVYNSKSVKIGNIDSIINKYFTSKIVDITKMESSPVTSSYFNGNKDTGNQTIYNLRKNLTVKDMYVNGFYGGIYTVEENSSEFNELIRTRYVKPGTLRPGDILIINDPDEKIMYLCAPIPDASDIRLTTVKDKKVVINNNNSSTLILRTLIGQNNFIVIRPSLAMNDEIELVNKPLSSNNNLKSLKLDYANIEFNKNTTKYEVNVSSSVDTIKVSAELEDSSSSFVKNFGPRSVNIVSGKNEILLKVKAENGNEKVYTINVNRSDEKSSNNNLKTLEIDVSDIDFNKSKTTYKINVDGNVKSIYLYAELEDYFASFVKDFGPRSVNLVNGENEILLKVKAENGNEKIYTIIVNKDASKSSDTSLKSLSINPGTIEFNSKVFEYNTVVDEMIESVDISAIANDSKATVNIEKPKSLSYGSNEYKVIVTAENGNKKTYKINVYRKKSLNEVVPDFSTKSSNSNILNIIIPGIKLNFNKDIKVYNINTSLDKLNIRVVLEDNKATSQIIGNNNLKNGSVIKINVIAEDETVSTYTLNVVKSENEIDYINLIIVIASFMALIVVFIAAVNIHKNNTKRNNKHINNKFIKKS